MNWLKIVLCLLMLGLPGSGWSAIVPDGSVVKSEDQAPGLPGATPAKKPRPVASETPGPKSDPTPAAAVERPRPSDKGDRGANAAFGGQAPGDNDNPGETAPLKPLAPAPVSTASTTPLWAALVVFLFLAIGGFWLAQQRNQD